MLSPTTPRSTRLCSPAQGDADENPSAILTPGRKIRALLAAFDSDSSEDDVRPSRARNKLSAGLDLVHQASTSHDEKNDDDALPSAPRGRLAARLYTESGASQPPKGDIDMEQGNLSDTSQSSLGSTPFSTRRSRSHAGLKRRSLSHRDSSPLFVPQDSPVRRVESGNNVNQLESEAEPQKTQSRFEALVAQKRKEREEKEQQEAEKKAERMNSIAAARSQSLSDAEATDEEDDDGNEIFRKLTQKSRPPRKASKRALLEMNRETQRMSRNMQLTHQATTKKTFSVSSFLERFSKNCTVKQGLSTPDSALDSTNCLVPSSVSHSDNDNAERDGHVTPPTSPLQQIDIDEQTKIPGTAGSTIETNIDTESAAIPEHNITDATFNKKENISSKEYLPKPTGIPQNIRQVRINLSREAVAEGQKNDSDSDLEVVTSPAKARKLALFENFSAKTSSSSDTLRKLKLLARVTSPAKNRGLTRAEHEAFLLRRARKQAADERAEKIAALQAKGVHIQTAEEKACIEEDVEDLMEKARKEADKIARREKATKKEKNQDSVDLENSDEDTEFMEIEESEDEDFEAEDEVEEQSENESSEELDKLADTTDAGDPIDDLDINVSEDELTDLGLKKVSQPRRKQKFIVSDDDDDEEEVEEEEEEEEEPAIIAQTPVKLLIPDLGMPKEPLIGLSQAFAATLADSQDSMEEHDSLSALRKMPGFDMGVGDLIESESYGVPQDSQVQDSGTLNLLAEFPGNDTHLLESPATKTVSEFSQIPEPSQDIGFVMSPFDQRKRFLSQPPSTIDTVPVLRDESPAAKRPGRRLRRGAIHPEVDAVDDFLVQPSAFDVMRKAARKPETPFDKKKSKAKEVVDEAAEESEDEYAGLGGASDEESDEEDDLDLTMINDNSGEVVDEQELAALNANHARQKDEGEVNKLIRDITTGALRRKRGMGDDFDLSDSDDERVAARRRAKQREFAKMRKAILTDENITKIADDPKKQAFFKTIEDRDGDDGFDFLRDECGESSSDTGIMLDGTPECSKNSSEDANMNGKRPLNPAEPNLLNQPAAKLRRTTGSGVKKPSTLAEIRAQVSSLIGEPDSHTVQVVLDSQTESLEEDRAGARDSLPLLEPRQTGNPRRHGKVVDRLSLRRAASSNAAMSSLSVGSASSSVSKLAFHSSSSTPGFKRPLLLLRRSTSSSTASSSSSYSSSSGRSSGVTTPAAIAVVKSDGTGGVNVSSKKGAVNYYAAAREKEREMQLKKNLLKESAASRKTLEEHRANREKRLTGLHGGGNWGDS
ncbi:hypothetical protein LOZ61_004392 [Ophidiomyces ophidiicola]|nr:hypothetical protein LOZ61_004392 [Ophidiomyces ophidiicola]KAI1914277.1 hypothetical protein LOZ64_003899 [Ophidiomyces ophidiicola]KAI1925655.1 hypothetical protein LOZ60_003976 [Ophidiomyces ophidiicola]KAI1955609.1 hypothetical protein LOZ59_004482 [Ophidiomyces ophidiicola]KAI2011252.1 hypothetical protein LOZ49_003130 [Ophidiomyces ophidiicola]